MQYNDILDFWFVETAPSQWFATDDTFDAEIKSRFGDLHRQAIECELWDWRQQADGRLAEIIVLDQFSRNIFRDSPQAFAQDAVALALAQEAIACGDDGKLPSTQRAFLYMPFMHSESPLIHQRAVELFSQPGLEFNLKFELRHKEIIDRFGRYPHRNAVLGRTSSAEEMAFLQEPGSSF